MGSDTARSGPPAIVSRAFNELTTTELLAILRLRSEVFVVEQSCAYNDIDGLDEQLSTVHHWIAADTGIAAYAREIRDGRSIRIGRVVTAPDQRGRGHGAQLVAAIRDNTHGPLGLEAQTHLVEWYRQFGFDIAGPDYVEDGISHTPMHIRPDTAT